MKIIIDIDENVFTRLFDNGTEDYAIVNDDLFAIAKSIRNGTPLTEVLDKIKAEIESCLKALDEIEETKFNIFLPNEMNGRKLTYRQCLDFIDKYRKEQTDADSN